MSGQSIYRRATVLGLTIAVGAFAIDMYIPGFAAIARDLHTHPGTVELSMTSFFVALAIGQVIYGPVSDTLGRKGPIYVGLGVFAVASVGAAFEHRHPHRLALLPGVGRGGDSRHSHGRHPG
jgi:DHA1 family bicyclomycin/chloramphenicol resistance-like MFS transporter